MSTDEPADARQAPGGLVDLIHLACHLAVWSAVLVPTLVELSEGWRPFGDDAAIAARAHQVFTAHPPLVGLASSVSNQTGHTLFDPGPLLFYLLSVPVRADPAHGLMWGAAIVCGIALSIAIEAAWSVGGWLGGSLVAFAVVDLLWLTPGVFDNLPWNASFPVPFLIAAFALGVAACIGSPRWWPVLVVFASVAAQTHLFFVVPAVALVVVSLAFGVVRSWRGRGFGWLITGVVLGAVCWVAPIVQQFNASYGNLTGLLHAGDGQATLGLSFALRDVGLAAAFHPVWLTHLPTAFYPLAALETAYPTWYGGLVLGALVIVGLGALLTRRSALGATALLTLAAGLGLVVSLAIFPTKNAVSLDYLIDAFWLLGIALWVVALWTLGTVLLAAAARMSHGVPRRGWFDLIAPLGSVLALAAVIGVGVLGIQPAAAHPVKQEWSTADVRLVDQVATAIEDQVPPGPVSVLVLSSSFSEGTWATEGIAYRLESDGWQVGTSGPPATYTGLTLPRSTPAPSFVLRLNGTAVASLTRS